MSDLHDARVEAVAKVLYERGWQGLRTWERDSSPASRSNYLKKAVDILAAADAVVTVDEAALIREAKAEALEEKGYFLKGHAEWTRSNFLPGPHSDACAKYNDEIGDELIEDAAELRARAAEYREGSET